VRYAALFGKLQCTQDLLVVHRLYFADKHAKGRLRDLFPYDARNVVDQRVMPLAR
jgi:hypothetical protein